MDAVVFTVTVTLAAVPEFTCTLDGTLQLGPLATEGLTLQEKFTVPLNDPDGVTLSLKVAASPGLTVAELGEPVSGASKKDDATPVPESPIVCDPEPALSVTTTDALAAPAAVGVNVTLIVQLVAG